MAIQKPKGELTRVNWEKVKQFTIVCKQLTDVSALAELNHPQRQEVADS